MIPSFKKKHIVLVGGGQTHAPVLKKMGMSVTTNVNVTLISENSIVPYSGMLPGYVAGFYTKEECLIDLRHLTNFANVSVIQAKVIGLDLKNNLVLLEGRPPINYDILSLNVGIIPNTTEIIGNEYISPIKPAISFFKDWIRLIERIQLGEYGNSFRVGILGAGAGGIELAFNIQTRLRSIIPNSEIHLFQKGKEILSGLNQSTRNKIVNLLDKKQIQLHLSEEILEISSTNRDYSCKTNKNNIFKLDYIIGAMNAKTLTWIEQCELEKDKKGFILVNDYLQSISHANVFAVGDIATMQNYPRPKAGVFAVRQSVPLYKNLFNLANGTKLTEFKPQLNFLTLLNTGDGKAIASRGKISLGASKWIWDWKNKIDTDFMNKFQNLPYSMKNKNPTMDVEDFQCKGCGGKSDSDSLHNALNKLDIYLKDNHLENSFKNSIATTLIGLKEREDSSQILISKNTTLVQSVDYIQPIVDDLFLSGRIAANHSLNDLYAKGIKAHSAQAIISLDKTSNQSQEDLFQILAGAMSVFSKEGVELLGGHTNSSSDFGIGFVCNGFSSDKLFYSKKNAKPGEFLVLTKPIGVGLTFAANMRNRVNPLTVEAAIHAMEQSNFTAMNILSDFPVGACTDITGFGLAGHMIDILKDSNLNAEITLDTIPILFELEVILENHPEIQSSLFPSNWKSFENYITGKKSNPIHRLFFDPQTSGGFLFSINKEKVDDCVLKLKLHNYEATIIGALSKNILQNQKLIECK